MQALQEPGKLLSQEAFTHGSGIWSMITLLVAQSISSEVDSFCANSVAVSIECCVCAIDLLDDIEDGDQTAIVQELGIARVLTTATALLTLAQHAILSLFSQDIPPERVIRLLELLQESILTCTTGQHIDVLVESRPVQEFPDEESIEIARQKAGSLMRLAFLAGAICARADDEACKLFAELGELLGVAAQLDNDCHDLYSLLQDENIALSTEMKSVPKSVKTDLIRGKKTLPIVLAAKSGVANQNVLSLHYGEKDQAYKQALQEGILTAWGICLLYRERARGCLQKIEARHPISPELRFLLGFA
jgi:geranylgeranyl pyrophosphate synthase